MSANTNVDVAAMVTRALDHVDALELLQGAHPARTKAIRETITRLSAMVEEKDAALKPFAAFIDQYERKPVKWHEEFVSIHVGTEYEASLRLSDLRCARQALTTEQG